MGNSVEEKDVRTPAAGSRWVARMIILALLLGAVAGIAYWGSIPGGDVLTNNLSEPLNGVTIAKVEIDSGTGHLAIDRLTGGEQVLASGTLQYFESQGIPNRTANTSNGQATLALNAGAGATGQSWFRLPWAACAGGAYEWQIHLDPTVSTDITAHSAGGNVKLNLAGMAISRVSAVTEGGNMDLVLPNNAASLSAIARTGGGNVDVEIGSGITGSNTVSARSGAGNVVVRVPRGVAARIHATGGLGRVTVDPRFDRIDKSTYQSSDYDGAANRVEITVNSGAGNASVNTK